MKVNGRPPAGPLWNLIDSLESNRFLSIYQTGQKFWNVQNVSSKEITIFYLPAAITVAQFFLSPLFYYSEPFNNIIQSSPSMTI